MKYLILLIAIMVTSISPTKAQIERYEFDKAHTQIIFGANHLGYTTSRGKFMDFDGWVRCLSR